MGIYGGRDGTTGQAVADPQTVRFFRMVAIYNKHTPLGQRIYRKHSKVIWKVVELQFFLFMIIEKIYGQKKC